jgi:hypothetical protein
MPVDLVSGHEEHHPIDLGDGPNSLLSEARSETTALNEPRSLSLEGAKVRGGAGRLHDRERPSFHWASLGHRKQSGPQALPQERDAFALLMARVSGTEGWANPALRVDLLEGEALAGRLLDRSAEPSGEDLCLSNVEILGWDLLPDGDEDWVLSAAESWPQLPLHALEALARRLTARAHSAAAMVAALAVVRAEPLRESAHALVGSTWPRATSPRLSGPSTDTGPCWPLSSAWSPRPTSRSWSRDSGAGPEREPFRWGPSGRSPGRPCHSGATPRSPDCRKEVDLPL